MTLQANSKTTMNSATPNTPNKSIRWCALGFALLLPALLSLHSCDGNSQVTEKIPTGPVNLNIDLNLPAYMQLANPGSHAYFEGGIKGVLVIHDYDDSWYAFERGCAFQPLDNCSRIWADSVNIQLQCGTPTSTGFQPCCSSKYTYSGFPLQGEARGRLARYQIQRSGNAVMVFN